MLNLSTISALALAVVFASAATSLAGSERNPANTISLEADHADSFRHFSPELPQMRARVATFNTDFGLHLSEIEPGLFFVADLIYQRAAIVTGDGVVVFDAPPSFGENLRKAIALAAPSSPITHLIISHGHRDHNKGTKVGPLRDHRRNPKIAPALDG